MSLLLALYLVFSVYLASVPQCTVRVSLSTCCARTDSESGGSDAELDALMARMQQQQATYKEKFVALKGVKCTLHSARSFARSLVLFVG